MPKIKLLAAATATNSPPTVYSTMTITMDTAANMTTGDLLVIHDGIEAITFEYRKDSAAVSQSTYKLIDISADTTAANVRDRTITAIGAARHTAPYGGIALRLTAATSSNNIACTSMDWMDANMRQNRFVPAAGAATIGQWTGSTQGFSLGGIKTGTGAGLAGPGLENLDTLWAWVRSVAGSGTMTVSIRVWVLEIGNQSPFKAWTPLGAGTDANKGMLNQANAANSYLMGETKSDLITHTELLTGMSAFDRVYFEIVAINGTSTAIDAGLMSRGHVAGSGRN